MKKTLLSLSLIILSKNALAGDNGSYLNCVSASGKTQLVMGYVGGYDKGETVMFSVMGRSIGTMEVDSSVRKVQLDENTTRFIELDHDGDDLLTIRELPVTDKEDRRQIRKFDIISGYNPNKMAPLTTTIKVSCKTVYNPI